MPHAPFHYAGLTVVEVDDCWRVVSPHTLRPDGYVTVSRGGNSPQRAHRITILHAQGLSAIPEGMQVDHLCRVTWCCNPDHLEIVTPRVNSLRSRGIPAINAAKRFCAQGHEFTPENTKIKLYPDGRFRQRRCVACWRADDAKRRQLRNAA